MRLAATTALAVYWIVLVVATHIPNPPEAIMHDNTDKWLHTSAYAVLAALMAANWALRKPLPWWVCVGLMALAAFWGAIDEVTQIPFNRACDFYDWLADLIGSVLGAALFFALWSVLGRWD